MKRDLPFACRGGFWQRCVLYEVQVVQHGNAAHAHEAEQDFDLPSVLKDSVA